jgi:nicotinamidase-related amidase
MVDWWDGDKMERDSASWQIIDRFNTSNKIIIDKNQYSAFFKTNLDALLKEENIKDVIVTGVMTNCCCETTARDAFMHGYRVFFINDATTTTNEELHLATLKNLSFGFARVQNTQDIINDIASSPVALPAAFAIANGGSGLSPGGEDDTDASP